MAPRSCESRSFDSTPTNAYTTSFWRSDRKPHSRSYSGYFVGAAARGVSLPRTATKRRFASDAGICGVDDGGSLPRSWLIVVVSLLMSDLHADCPGEKWYQIESPSVASSTHAGCSAAAPAE